MSLLDLLPQADGSVDPRLLLRASQPGRVRGIGLELWERVAADPVHAGSTLRHGLRDARALHSRERRFVADMLYAMVRLHGWLHAAYGADPLVWWLGLTVAHGLGEAEASAALQDAGKEPVARWGAALGGAIEGLGADEALAVAGSIPVAVARELREAFGDDASRFLLASAARAPIVLRARPGRRASLTASLRRQGVEAVPCRFAPDGVEVPTSTDLRRLTAQAGADFEVQDEASQLIAALVQAAPGLRVLDACAGAGGKTLALADAAGPRAVVAADVRGGALKELARRADRAGLRGIQTVRIEEGAPDDGLGLFDRVLVDAPCAGTGVWRRHPELRWKLGELDALRATQAAVLATAAGRVKPGGRLVYATCSVLPSENEAQAAAFEAQHPDFVRVDAAGAVGEACVQGGALRMAPHTHGTDGFYGVVWERRGPAVRVA